MDRQEFVNETVFDKRIIRSPAKRNYRPYGTGRGRDAECISMDLPRRGNPVIHVSVRRKSVRTLCRIFFVFFSQKYLHSRAKSLG